MPWLEIVDAHKHNLKNVHLRIPKKKLVVISGVSGSGKSSLAFDTIFQEGQRRYLESLSTYARQYIKSLERPDVQCIRGIAPTISIDQKHASYHFNSSVGTISEISPFLRVLFARLGNAHCPKCDQPIDRLSRSQMAERLHERFPGEPLQLFSVLVRNRRGHYQALLEKYRRRGYLKALVDGAVFDLENLPELDRHQRHTIAVQVDEVETRPEERERIAESVAVALQEGDGELLVKRAGGGLQVWSERLHCDACGISLREPQPGTFSFNSPEGACPLCQGSGGSESGLSCPDCHGSGLNPEARAFRLDGRGIHELGEMEAADLAAFFRAWRPAPGQAEVARPLLPQIRQRLESLVSLNLGYIALNRRLHTLSGGELQRARLVSQIGFRLHGIIYILDEPSIGMHPAEQRNLIRLLRELRDQGNSVLVVEHDEATLRAADYIVDVGPGPGERGGEIVFAGPRSALRRARASLTSAYLYRRRSLAMAKSYRTGTEWLELRQVSVNNVREADLRLPLGALTVVSGVSGSGKSSLLVDALYPLLQRHLEPGAASGPLPQAGTLTVPPRLKRALLVTQSAIGKNSRSCPATYVGILPMIRELFSGLPEAKVRGYGPGRFSFNVRGGRCEACEGLGVQKLQMSFLPQLEVACPACEGRRYNSETLRVHYRGHSIADVLEQTAAEAGRLFANVPWLASRLRVLDDVGLGYLRLGQSSTTLSGGESQRIKLTRELARPAARPTLYILDEPTVGLHFEDVGNLLRVFGSLIVNGHTVVVIEHNLDVLRAADHVIDLGPGGGRHGGRVLYQGGTAGLACCRGSQTGRFLRPEGADAVS